MSGSLSDPRGGLLGLGLPQNAPTQTLRIQPPPYAGPNTDLAGAATATAQNINNLVQGQDPLNAVASAAPAFLGPEGEAAALLAKALGYLVRPTPTQTPAQERAQLRNPAYQRASYAPPYETRY